MTVCMVALVMSMAQQKERQRKFHRRSKNGCQACKKRHVRCDERQPLCTHCLQSGAECNYPPTSRAQPDQSTSASEGQLALVAPTNPSCALSDYVGGSFDALPAASKRLLQHFSLYAIQGQKPVARRLESTAIQRAFENPGYMHMCLMLSACQWAWVTGSMDAVRIPFLHHKAATYQFVRQQLQSHETAQGGDTMLAISALALTEGAVGELNASSKHLQGIRMATQGGYVGQASSLPQRMLKMIGNGLRTGRSAKLVNVPDYQPTFMALLFASIWDVTTLPPREAPRYGWWEESDTQAARLWQNYTKDLNLNYEISRGFGSTDYIPQILNGDPRSSRTSFIATFFYLCSEMGHQHLDVVLIDWLLEQLIDDVKMGEDQMASSTWSQPLWLWCVMFGAAIASLGRPTNTTEERQLQKWKDVYDEKIRLLNHLLGFDSWHSAKALMAAIAGPADEDVDLGLQQLWDKAVNGDSNATLGRS
ncbi:hypothetical protein B0I35DRAFT_22233 [Stachybotrys elegans]|uniref:Zn(2)-C6 fungal-type domain-containing protein n=1 Tax=Stachybotrys elegans TaxID=80388 RepID=A0A8K0SYS3_9HYPO|nr:hypothetical protein B0I35DRAFT_22233 [Stachybotrys elegans]